MTQILPNYESGSPRRPSMTSDYNEDIFDEVIEEYSEVYYIKPLSHKLSMFYQWIIHGIIIH